MALGSGTRIIRDLFTRLRSRGAVVPFETPALCMARVCEDERDGLIAILRDFANNGTSYIVPWASLPLIAKMNDHDMAIHAAVREHRACTPEQVRAVVNRLALSGALGPEAKRRETERSQTDRTLQADVELILTLHLLQSCGMDLANLMTHPSRWRDKDAKAAIAAAAKKACVKRHEIYRRLNELAALLTPVGLPAAAGDSLSGWLRMLSDEIEAFGSATAAARAASPEAGALLDAIAQSAGRTAGLSGIVLGVLDSAALDIRGTIRRWNTERPVLRESIERLSSALDEWPPLIKLARNALRAPAAERIQQLRRVRAVLPPWPEAGLAQSAYPAGGGSGAAELLTTRLSTIRSMLGAHRAAA